MIPSVVTVPLGASRQDTTTFFNASFLFVPMVYVRPDGSVSNRRSIWRVLQDFISAIVGVVTLFVSAVFNPPQLEVRFVIYLVAAIMKLSIGMSFFFVFL